MGDNLKFKLLQDTQRKIHFHVLDPLQFRESKDQGCQKCLCSVTCCKLLNSHQWEADKRKRFAQYFPLVLWNHLKLLPLTLSLRPANHCIKQTNLPDPQGIPLQHRNQGVCKAGQIVTTLGTNPNHPILPSQKYPTYSQGK